jgi:hypothetical protein
MRPRQRLARIEAYQRRRMPFSHFVSIVLVPWERPVGTDQETWLREEVMCRCGRRGCSELRIGALLPEKAPSAEA